MSSLSIKVFLKPKFASETSAASKQGCKKNPWCPPVTKRLWFRSSLYDALSGVYSVQMRLAYAEVCLLKLHDM